MTRALVTLLLASALYAADSDAVRKIERRFIAPCCWSENLTIHQSDVAVQMRSEIERLVATGRTEEEIVDLYVARYGERILAVPRGARLWVLTLTPLLILMAGAYAVVRYLSRHRQLAATPEGSAPVNDDDFE